MPRLSDGNRQKTNYMMQPPKSIAGYRLGLASGSPRRRELLAMLDIPFHIVEPLEIDESYPDSLEAHEVPLYLSRLKADAYRPSMADDDLYITADTVVIVGGEVLGKPRDEAEAVGMLRRLSGCSHEVVTGVTVFTRRKTTSFKALTTVEFAAVPDDEIEEYVGHYHPLDKAGAYGIQEWIGAVGIRRIDGSFYNVMGLPVHRLWEVLKQF